MPQKMNTMVVENSKDKLSPSPKRKKKPRKSSRNVTKFKKIETFQGIRNKDSFKRKSTKTEETKSYSAIPKMS